MLKRIALITLLAATTAITGCANSDVYSGDVYTKDRAKQVQTVSYGTILSTRPVKIQADENSLIGTIGGAVVGGLLGSTIGGGAAATSPPLAVPSRAQLLARPPVTSSIRWMASSSRSRKRTANPSWWCKKPTPPSCPAPESA